VDNSLDRFVEKKTIFEEFSYSPFNDKRRLKMILKN